MLSNRSFAGFASARAIAASTAAGTSGLTWRADGGGARRIRITSGGQWQIWTRSPGGEERQATFLGGGSGIVALGPGGRLVSFAPGQGYRYVVPPCDGASIDVGLAGSGFVFLEGSLLKLVGNTVFRVVP